MNYPFKEKAINESVKIRLFESTVSEGDLVWHRDKNSRLVEVMSGIGWKFQRDNDLPFELKQGDIFEIFAGEYHRLLKGKSDLRLRIVEKIDQNKDGKNDFEDIKIARMKASGMSAEEIKKKHPELFEDAELEEKKKLSDKVNPAYLTGKKTRKTKSNKEMEREIDKCAKKPRPKSCYDEWSADKIYKKNKKESVAMLQDLIKEELYIINEKLSKKTRETLKKKAKDANMPLGALTAVYRKGLAAWLSGHRQGVSQHQWAMARVNSFIKGGKTRSVDKAEWKKVQKHRSK